MKSLKILLTIRSLLLVVLWATMSTFGAGYLSQLESGGLFLFSWDFIVENLSVPGGLLSLAASFLTQFLHLPWLGSLIWVLLCAVSARQASRLTGHDDLLSLFPAACSTAAAMGLGYLIFKIKLPAHAFTTLIGAMAAMALACWYEKGSRRRLSMTVIALSFPLIGFYSVLTALTVIVWEFRQKSVNWRNVLVIGLAAMMVPAVLSQFYVTVTPTGALLASVPLFPKGCGWTSYLPYLLLAAYLVFGQLVHISTEKRKSRVYELSSVLLVVLLFWVKDPNFNAQMRMTRATDRMEWEKSLRAYRIAQSLNEPSTIMALYRNLALVRIGNEGETCFSFRDGSRKQKLKVKVSESQQAGRQLFYHFGIPNYSYRWCFENQAETGWSVQDLRYMAMCCIVKGERETATKYLDLLQKTLFYGRWAYSQWQYVNNPELLAQSSEYGQVMPLLATENNLGNDGALLEIFLNTRFLTEPNDSPELSRVALMWAALSQKGRYFWPAFNNFVNNSYLTRVPTQYQQAMLMLNYASEDADISNIPFDTDILEEFNHFIGFLETHPIKKSRIKEAQKTYKEFKGTYYYYYLFREVPSLVFYQNEDTNTIYN